MRGRAIPVGVVVAAVAAVPAMASAEVVTVGSSLEHAATLTQDPVRGADTVFWQRSLGGDRRTTMPASGQILEIEMRGTAVKARGGAEPLNEVHFQTLRPSGGGVSVIVTSQPFRVPFDGDRNQITRFRPENMCVQAGDYVGFNEEGGFDPGGGYPEGVPFRVFGRVPSALTEWFSADNGTNNGSSFAGATMEGRELLMRVKLGTGSDATPLCPRGASSTGAGGSATVPVTVPSQRPAMSSRGRVRLTVFCHAAGGCTGRVTLTARGRRIGRAGFRIGRGTRKIAMRLNRATRRRLVRRGASIRATARITGTGADATRSITLRR